MDVINAWWEREPGERYWLDATERDGRNAMLAAARGSGRRAGSWTNRLITHVRGGDVVFHWDASRQAIVACSISHGRVEKRDLSWTRSVEPDDAGPARRTLPSWGIPLHRSTLLEVAVPLEEIARMQWSLFPSLRALEDRVGFPLYFPFEMGDRDSTRLLTGYVFKLPALFVQAFPALAGAAGLVARRRAA